MFDLIYRNPWERNTYKWKGTRTEDLAKEMQTMFDDNFWKFSHIISTSKPVWFESTKKVDGKPCYVIELVAPGLNKEDFSIEVQGTTLWIGYQLEAKRDYAYGERVEKRSFILDKNVSQDSISASYEAGILKVLIPKPEAKQKEGPEPHKIKVD